MISVIVDRPHKIYIFNIDKQERTITFQISGDGRRYVRPYKRNILGCLYFIHNGERYYIDEIGG